MQAPAVGATPGEWKRCCVGEPQRPEPVFRCTGAHLHVNWIHGHWSNLDDEITWSERGHGYRSFDKAVGVVAGRICS